MSARLGATWHTGGGGPPAAATPSHHPQWPRAQQQPPPPRCPSVTCSAGRSDRHAVGSGGRGGGSGASNRGDGRAPSRLTWGGGTGGVNEQWRRRQPQPQPPPHPSPAGDHGLPGPAAGSRAQRLSPREAPPPYQSGGLDEQEAYGNGSREAARPSSPPRGPGPGLPEVSLISSPSNAYVKHLVRLRSSAPYRREMRRVLLVGAELLQEAAGDSPAPLSVRVLLLLSEGAAPPRKVVAERVVWATEAVLKKVSGVESAGGVDAVAELDLPPERTLSQLLRLQTDTPTQTHRHHSPGTGDGSSPVGAHPPATGRTASGGSEAAATAAAAARPRPVVRLLVLDGVQDPGNLGSLARSALAFGWGGLFLLPGCCDPLNDKAVRASRGALLRLPTAVGSLGELAAAAGEAGLLMLSADMEEDGAQQQPQGRAEGPEGGRGGILESGGLLPLLYGTAGGGAAADDRDGRGAGGGEPAAHRGQGAGGTDADAAPPGPRSGPGCGGVALVLGSEGSGLSPAVRALCARVSVPMEGSMESLNVGVAGAILMFALSSGPPQLFAKLAARLQAAAAEGEGAGRS